MICLEGLRDTFLLLHMDYCDTSILEHDMNIVSDYRQNNGNALNNRLTDNCSHVHCESKNCATFIFTVTLANVGRFFKFFQCRNQKEMAHNKNEKFPTIA